MSTWRALGTPRVRIPPGSFCDVTCSCNGSGARTEPGAAYPWRVRRDSFSCLAIVEMPPASPGGINRAPPPGPSPHPLLRSYRDCSVAAWNGLDGRGRPMDGSPCRFDSDTGPLLGSAASTTASESCLTSLCAVGHQ